MKEKSFFLTLIVRGYPFRGFKSIELELDICQTKLLNQFFSF